MAILLLNNVSRSKIASFKRKDIDLKADGHLKEKQGA